MPTRFGFLRSIPRPLLVGLSLVLLALPFLGASCLRGSSSVAPDDFTLRVWRYQDDRGALDATIEKYRLIYPQVQFDVRVLAPDEYEDELFAAWARGDGPDIFSVPNTRLGKFTEFISPMPASVTLQAPQIKKRTFSADETVVEERVTQLPTANQVRDQFVQTVAEAVINPDTEQVYGLPLSMDSLVLYYNRDLLASGGVAVPPTNWIDFSLAVENITVRDQNRDLVTPAAALGTSTNVPYAFDIVSALMMQNGATMVDGQSIAFQRGTEDNRVPAAEALGFYLSFSNPITTAYTWNADQVNALDAFVQGNLGFYIGYYSDLADITRRAPNVNVGYTALPQVNPSTPVNYPRFPIETVHIQSAHTDYAWNFVQLLTAEEDAQAFALATGRLPARTQLVGKLQTDPAVGVVVNQFLTAHDWYRGLNPDDAIAAFTEMIDAGQVGDVEATSLIGQAAEKVNLTYKK